MRHYILGVWIVAVVDSAMSLSAAEQKKKAPAKDARVIKIPISRRGPKDAGIVNLAVARHAA